MFFLGRKQSHSPSPSRNASPNRALSPSGNRTRDRSASPLRYINLPVSRLARVTEELESLINPTATTVHEVPEEEEEQEKEKEKQVSTPTQQDKPTTTNITEPEEIILLPQVSTPVIQPEETSTYIQEDKPTITEIVKSEESITLPEILPPITVATEEEKQMDISETEVSYKFSSLFIVKIYLCRNNKRSKRHLTIVIR